MLWTSKVPFKSSNCTDFIHILDIYLHTFNVCLNICQFLRVCVCLSFACRLHLLYIVDMFLFLTCCFRFLFSSSKSCLNLFFVYFPHFYHHCHPSFKKGDAGSLWLMLFYFRYRKMFNIYHHFLFEKNSAVLLVADLMKISCVENVNLNHPLTANLINPSLFYFLTS